MLRMRNAIRDNRCCTAERVNAKMWKPNYEKSGGERATTIFATNIRKCNMRRGDRRYSAQIGRRGSSLSSVEHQALGTERQMAVVSTAATSPYPAAARTISRWARATIGLSMGVNASHTRELLGSVTAAGAK